MAGGSRGNRMCCPCCKGKGREEKTPLSPKMRSGLVKSWSFESQPPIATRGPAQLPASGPAGESDTGPTLPHGRPKGSNFYSHSGPFVTWPAHLESVPKRPDSDPDPVTKRMEIGPN
jgi:hypothetical protein